MANVQRRSWRGAGRIGVGLALTLLLAAAGEAGAQARPDDTRVLDANLSTTSRYNQPRTGFLLNRINDAIVTGTAPGGMSFRGDVGYRSTFEFRGDIAGRQVYDFQRDSYSSNLAAQRYAPRHSGVLGSYQVPRPGGISNSPYALGSNVMTPLSGANLQQIARDRYGTGYADLEGEATLRQLRPPPTAVQPGEFSVVPSHLQRDLSLNARSVVVSADPLLDRVSLLNTLNRGIPDRASSARRRAVIDGVPVTGVPPERLGPASRGIESTFDGVPFMQGWSNRIAPASAAAASAGAPLIAGQDAYADYVARLAARGDTSALPPSGQPYGQQAITEMRDFARQWQGIAPPTTGGEAPALTATLAPIASLTDEQVASLSTPLPAIASLAGDNSSQFAEHVRRAEAALAEERYFDAESWFDVSLYYTPGHPLATAGRVHAQIGAGKYRSAALSLRLLFESHPELINSRYASTLLPSPQRLGAAIEELKEMRDQPGATIEADLLLAYLGHLTDQRELVQQSLDGLVRTQPDGPLTKVLRRVWLADEDP